MAYQMLIDGKMVQADKSFDVINPSSGQAFAKAPECSVAQLDAAVAAARRAFPKWAATPMEQRRVMMRAAAAALKSEQNQARLREVLVREQGKPVAMAQVELDMVDQYLVHFADRKYELEKVVLDSDTEIVYQKRTPLGVVGGITPWNFPVLMATWKLSEALMLGNTFVLKPSPYTPLTSLVVGEMLASIFPAGVVNIVCGSDDVGKRMTTHPDIAKISFTGSVRAGKLIQAATSGTLKRVTLELGGNDAAVVLDDADVATVAPAIFGSAMFNSGQVCVAVKRCYVPEAKYTQMVDALTAAAKASEPTFGDGFKEGMMFGPLNNKMQFEKVKELVDDARKNGATITTGGSPTPGNGYFYPPTIISNVKDGMRIVDEEQFGPALPVIPYKSLDDVIAKVNSGKLGLGGSVWTSDTKKGADVASRIESGTVWVNQHAVGSPDVPFVGAKESGIGGQMGESSIEGYTQIKIVRVLKTPAKL